MKMKSSTTLLLLVGLVVGLSLTVTMAGGEGTSEVASLDESIFWSSVPEKYVTELQAPTHEGELWFVIQFVLVDKSTLGAKVNSLLRELLKPEWQDIPYFFLVRLYKPRNAKGGRVRLDTDELNLMVGKKLHGLDGEFFQIAKQRAFDYRSPELTLKDPSQLGVLVPFENTTEILEKAIREENKIRIYYEDTEGTELRLPE